MEKIYNVHYKLRKGLGPEWVNKVEVIAFDDLPSDIMDHELDDMVRSEFKYRRAQRGTKTTEYIIQEIVKS